MDAHRDSSTAYSTTVERADHVLGAPLSKRSAVTTAVFAGRLGGNQGFVADADSEGDRNLLKRQPDAVNP